MHRFAYSTTSPVLDLNTADVIIPVACVLYVTWFFFPPSSIRSNILLLNLFIHGRYAEIVHRGIELPGN